MAENEVTTIEYALTLISRNDEKGVELLYEQMGAKMLLCARAVLSDRSAAEDAVQESFIKIVRNIRSYRKGSNAAAWVLTITRNAAVTELRKRKRFDVYSDENLAAVSSRENVENSVTDKTLVEQLLGSLYPPIVREMIYLKYYCDLGVRDIAAQVGKSKSYVAKEIAKAEKFLRENLTKAENDFSAVDENCSAIVNNVRTKL
mgnify:FL=1